MRGVKGEETKRKGQREGATGEGVKWRGQRAKVKGEGTWAKLEGWE